MNIVELIQNYNKNNNFEPILQHYNFYIKYLCRRFKIEEYLSSLGVKLWMIVVKIETNKFEVKNSIDFFIKKCLKNYAINLFKKYIANNLIIYNNEILNIETNKIYNSKNLDIETNINFYELVKILSKIQYKIIILRYDKCFLDTEIAKLLGISRQAVYKNRKHALEILKHYVLINYKVN